MESNSQKATTAVLSLAMLISSPVLVAKNVQPAKKAAIRLIAAKNAKRVNLAQLIAAYKKAAQQTRSSKDLQALTKALNALAKGCSTKQSEKQASTLFKRHFKNSNVKQVINTLRADLAKRSKLLVVAPIAPAPVVEPVVTAPVVEPVVTTTTETGAPVITGKLVPVFKGSLTTKVSNAFAAAKTTTSNALAAVTPSFLKAKTTPTETTTATVTTPAPVAADVVITIAPEATPVVTGTLTPVVKPSLKERALNLVAAINPARLWRKAPATEATVPAASDVSLQV